MSRLTFSALFKILFSTLGLFFLSAAISSFTSWRLEVWTMSAASAASPLASRSLAIYSVKRQAHWRNRSPLWSFQARMASSRT